MEEKWGDTGGISRLREQQQNWKDQRFGSVQQLSDAVSVTLHLTRNNCKKRKKENKTNGKTDLGGVIGLQDESQFQVSVWQWGFKLDH